MTCEILLLGSDQLSVENSNQFLFHIKHTGITTRFSPHLTSLLSPHTLLIDY
jgi:hypothetical protein